MHILGINYLPSCVFMLCRHHKVILQEFSGVPVFLFSVGFFLFCFFKAVWEGGTSVAVKIN